MTHHPPRLTLCGLLLALWAHAAQAGLPTAVQAELNRAQVPAHAVAAVVADVHPKGTVWLQYQAARSMNPASVMKLVTTFAALDTLGPAYTWHTQVWVDGPIRQGVLQGNLYVQGGGDPTLVSEKLWLLLQRVQGLGIRRIAGDVVLDRSAYRLPPGDPAAFDGQALRPYNVTPDALLINYKTQTFTFVPDVTSGVARVQAEPPLAGVDVPAEVALSDQPCTDWRGRLQADFSDALSPRFGGSYPLACGTLSWPVAHPEPERFAERAVLGLWQALGGQVAGRVRPGSVAAGATLLVRLSSPPLADVVRDVNKFSNNVMAQHVLLALGQASAADPSAPVADDSMAQARQVLSDWWQQRLGPTVPSPVIDNGAGLSREARISALSLARLLQLAYASPWMPELVSSLPVAGLDGTLRRSQVDVGMAHLKTGSLNGVVALAGYVQGRNGQMRVLVVLVNDPKAQASRPALDALVRWAAEPSPH